MQPVNYMEYYQQQNSGNNFLEGLQTGQAVRQVQMQNQAIENAKLAKEDLTNFFNKPNKTVDDYEQMRLKYPSMSDALTASYKNVNEEKKLNDFNIASQISGALNGGNKDLAKQILTKEKEAYQNSGDTKGVSSMDNILKSIDSNPNTALEMSNMFMASIYPDKFKDTYEGIVKTNIEKQKAPFELDKLKGDISKISADIGLTNAQTSKAMADTKKTFAEIGGIGLDTQKKAFELNALKESNGLVPADKKFDFEEKLRKEYTSRTSNFEESERVFSTIDASAKDKTGAGDIALVTSFMKMLDPQSVVRETEFATARDTAGLYDKLGNQLSKLQNGQFLSPSQRASFQKLAGDYMNATRGQKDKVKETYSKVAKNYGLNTDNVFTVETPTQQKQDMQSQTNQPQQNLNTEPNIDLSKKGYMSYGSK